MINPIRLCNDLFDDPALSDINLRGFSEDFLIRLTNNNPGGIYALLISDTTMKYTAYYGKMLGKGNQEHIQEGLTVAMNTKLNLVIAKIKNLQGLVIFKFGENSDIYQQFFPQGLEPFTRIRLVEAPNMFDEFVTACTTNLTAEYPAEVTAITGLVAHFKAARTAQENAFSLVDNWITGKHEDRKALTIQLTFDFLTIASNNIDNPDRFDDYYDPGYLPITKDTETAVVKEGTVNAGLNQNIDLTDVPGAGVSSALKLINPNGGILILRYYYADSPAGVPIPTVFADVTPGQELKKEANELGATTVNKYLIVQNLSGSNGNYKIEIVP